MSSRFGVSANTQPQQQQQQQQQASFLQSPGKVVSPTPVLATPPSSTASAALPIPALSKLSLSDIVGFAAVDAARTMCCMASAPPDLLYRSCQLIHLLLRRPCVARSELLQANDPCKDDIVCCAAGALFATAKAMSFLNLMATNDLINLMHRCIWRRRAASGTATREEITFLGGESGDLSAHNRTNLTQRVVRWEYVLLEASGFKVISPTPYPFAINLARLVHAAVESAAALENESQKSKSAASTTASCSSNSSSSNSSGSVPSYERFLSTVIAVCNDACRSPRLTTSTPAEVVAAAAVCKTVLGIKNGVCFQLLQKHVFPTMGRKSFPFCACLGEKCNDKYVLAAMEELDRVCDPNGAASRPARGLAQIWPAHQAGLEAQRKQEEAAKADREKIKNAKWDPKRQPQENGGRDKQHSSSAKGSHNDSSHDKESGKRRQRE